MWAYRLGVRQEPLPSALTGFPFTEIALELRMVQPVRRARLATTSTVTLAFPTDQASLRSKLQLPRIPLRLERSERIFLRSCSPGQILFALRFLADDVKPCFFRMAANAV